MQERRDLISFDDAVNALNEGKRVATIRQYVEGEFVFKQIPAIISIDVVPKMTSLPQSVKDEFLRRTHSAIEYKHQWALVKTNNLISYFVPTVEEIEGEWIILD